LPRDYFEQLKDFLKSETTEFSIVVMPDFFLDRLVTVNCDLETFNKNIRSVIGKKGGSIDNISQTDVRGGNAVNTASALAALGMKVTPIVCTDSLGMQLIRFHLRHGKIDFSHVKIFDQPSITTALEFEVEQGRVNVMLRDLGALADFGLQHLARRDFDAIEDADCVCVFNWAGTKKFGTELADGIFRHVKTKGRGKTYYDTADPSPNKEEIPKLLKSVLQSKNLDILSVNENEAISYAQLLDRKLAKKRDLPLDELALEAAEVLAKNLATRVDLHTTNFSATFTKKSQTIVPAFQVHVLRATGAGDAWNAGNIVGDTHGLTDSCRLALANAVAAYYISHPNALHPSKKELATFCEHIGVGI
jgi:sugar/nucleoside kinase (ribokinase family)